MTLHSFLLLIVAVSVAACRSMPGGSPYFPVSNDIRFAYPTMGFTGSYAKQLTLDDVRQIVSLARNNPKIVKPVQRIVIDRPDEAEVNSGPEENFALGTTFKVRKKNGRWMIIEKSINTGETIITS